MAIQDNKFDIKHSVFQKTPWCIRQYYIYITLEKVGF